MGIVRAYGSILVPAFIFNIYPDLIKNIVSRSQYGIDLFVESAARKQDIVSIPWCGVSTDYEKQSMFTRCLTDTNAGQKFAEILSSAKAKMRISYEMCSESTHAICIGWLIPGKNRVNLWQYMVETDSWFLHAKPEDVEAFKHRYEAYIVKVKNFNKELKEAVCF